MLEALHSVDRLKDRAKDARRRIETDEHALAREVEKQGGRGLPSSGSTSSFAPEQSGSSRSLLSGFRLSTKDPDARLGSLQVKLDQDQEEVAIAEKWLLVARTVSTGQEQRRFLSLQYAAQRSAKAS